MSSSINLRNMDNKMGFNTADEELLVSFKTIMESRAIQMVYQPIISMANGSVFGYEALARGPENSVFHSPLRLFSYAEQAGYLYQADKLAREKAIQDVVLEHPKQMLFINISSRIICDPEFIPGRTLEVLHRYGLKPSNVVFEITERSSIEDFALVKKILKHYRDQGYKIAIDDAGAGYSSLQAIAELHPDFVKIDRSLIENIHKEKTKEYIMETFVSFSQKMKIQLIAEGIETENELIKLARMGVHYVQGFLLGRPEKRASSISPGIIQIITQQRALTYSNGGRSTIGDLMESVELFEPEALISDVSRFFQEKESASAVVVADQGVPKGLITRDTLFQQLASPYGYSLYAKKTISQTMDHDPLVVDEAMMLEQVSQMAMGRDKRHLYDLVIVTRNGLISGVASIRSILERITQTRMETARVANPLTGLPGNREIQRELNKRMVEQVPFSVIYADLDFFKWFNDMYGFQKGDQLIQFTADIIQQTVSICGDPLDFVGHIGGDDFIAISGTDDPEMLCREIIRRFDLGVKTFYEADKPWDYVEDRQGNRVDSDGVTLSLSLVICECHQPFTFEQVSQTSAHLKKLAKANKGSIYMCHYLGSEPKAAAVGEGMTIRA